MITASELLRIRWNKNLTRSSAGAPLIAPLFVAEQGPAIQIADLRLIEKATGVLGYIPGSVFSDVERLKKIDDRRTLLRHRALQGPEWHATQTDLYRMLGRRNCSAA